MDSRTPIVLLSVRDRHESSAFIAVSILVMLKMQKQDISVLYQLQVANAILLYICAGFTLVVNFLNLRQRSGRWIKLEVTLMLCYYTHDRLRFLATFLLQPYFIRQTRIQLVLACHRRALRVERYDARCSG